LKRIGWGWRDQTPLNPLQYQIVRGVAAAKEVVVRGRRARPEGPAAALLDAVQRSGVQGVRGVEAKRERERLISISSWFSISQEFRP